MGTMSMDSMPMEQMKKESSSKKIQHGEMKEGRATAEPSNMPMHNMHGTLPMQKSSPMTPDKMQGGMSHDGMQHQQMSAMQMQTKEADAQPMAHADDVMEMAPMQGGSAPADARDPNAYSDGYDWGPFPPPHMGDHNFASLMVDKLELLHTNKNTTSAYDLKAWFGRDYDRVVLKAEGNVDKGKLQESRTEVLWGHAIAPYWDTQLGLRYDSGTKPDKGWLAFGVEGLAPYWFDVEATGYLADEGRTALRLAASYDILFTQKFVLKPEIEANFYGKDDAKQAVGSGLSDITAGLRLRYHLRRELAPYVGVEWSSKFGGTADYARLAGERSKETRIVAGIQFWF